jgi:hypothetical protein
MPGFLITMGAVGVLEGKTWGEVHDEPEESAKDSW